MTYKVFGGTLSLTQSINQSLLPTQSSYLSGPASLVAGEKNLLLLLLQEPFPKRFPFSQFVPRIYSEVKEYITACLQFSEDLNLRY